jgi:hypothetical protein
MTGAYVYDVSITSDPVIQMIEVMCAAFLEKGLQFTHCDCITLCVVESEVADLKEALEHE